MEMMIPYQQSLMTGVYKITNTYNNMYYIGSAKRSFRARFVEHKRRLSKELSDVKNGHHNRRMWAEYRKRPEYFKFEALCFINGAEEIQKNESVYLCTLVGVDHLCYNITTNKERRFNV